MSTNQSNSGAQSVGPNQDSIIVTKLPNQLPQDLRHLLLGHFANFGRILRFSCVKGRLERTAHIQFSSVDAVKKALENGKRMQGHCLSITPTEKHPSTHELASCPTAIPATLESTPLSSASTASSSSGTSRQTSIQEFLRNKNQTQEDVKERKPLESKPKILLQCHCKCQASQQQEASPSQLTEIVSSGSSAVAPNSGETAAEPNTCLGLELYRGPAATPSIPDVSSPPPASTNLTVTETLIQRVRLQQQKDNLSHPGFRFIRQNNQVRSLRELFHFDIPHMKVIKNNVTPSTALACQFFTGGVGKHPFPLALMFGRSPGTVLMPVSNIMSSIKPTMEITMSALELIWNSVENGIIRQYVRDSAESMLKFEKTCGPMIELEVRKMKDTMIDNLLEKIADEEMTLENEILNACEDAYDAILEVAFEDLLWDDEQSCVQKELRLARKVESVADAHAENLLETIGIGRVLKEEAANAIMIEYCQEVVDDLLDFWVKSTATLALKMCREEQNHRIIGELYGSSIEENVVDALIREVIWNECIDEHCKKANDDLLFGSTWFALCVKVVAKEALEQYRSRNSSSSGLDFLSWLPTLERRRRTSAWITTISESQSSVEANYISPPPSTTSTLSSSQREKEEDTAAGSADSPQENLHSPSVSSSGTHSSNSNIDRRLSSDSDQSVAVPTSSTTMTDQHPTNSQNDDEAKSNWMGKLKRRLSFKNLFSSKKPKREEEREDEHHHE